MNVTVISYFFPGGHDVDALDEDEDEPDDEDDDAEPRDHAHDQAHGGNEAEMSIDVCCLLSSQEAIVQTDLSGLLRICPLYDIHYFILKEWLGPFCLTMFNCLIDKTKAHLHLLITLLSPEECGEPRAEVAGQDVVADVYVLGESATRNVFTN